MAQAGCHTAALCMQDGLQHSHAMTIPAPTHYAGDRQHRHHAAALPQATNCGQRQHTHTSRHTSGEALRRNLGLAEEFPFRTGALQRRRVASLPQTPCETDCKFVAALPPLADTGPLPPPRSCAPPLRRATAAAALTASLQTHQRCGHAALRRTAAAVSPSHAAATAQAKAEQQLWRWGARTSQPGGTSSGRRR